MLPDDATQRWYKFLQDNYPQLLQGATPPAGVGTIAPPPAPTIPEQGVTIPPPGAFNGQATTTPAPANNFTTPTPTIPGIQAVGGPPPIKTVVATSPAPARSQTRRKQKAM